MFFLKKLRARLYVQLGLAVGPCYPDLQKTEGGWRYLAVGSSREKEVLRVCNNQKLHHFNIGLLLIVRLSDQITCIQGPSKQDPGLSFPVSEGRVAGSSAVMENDTFFQVLVSILPRVMLKEVF
jgi:hypothetical protein